MRFYCGIDLGSRAAQVCVVDETDRICLQRNVPCELGAVLELLERFDPKPEVVVESTFNWYWLVDGLMVTTRASSAELETYCVGA